MKYDAKYRTSWALVIGINNYKRVAPLAQATTDATEVARTLREEFKFPPENVTVLLDEDATISNIRSRFMSYTDEAVIDPDDRLVVFFAGHGHTVRGNRGEVGFLVPVEGDAADLGSLIRWDELTRNADLIPAKHVFFLMDACYGGLALTRAPAFGSMRFMSDMLRRYARQVLAAGKADETVADGGGVRPGHSIFTAHLLDALEGAAATTDGIITANSVMSYVYERVARDQYSHQTPHYGFVQGDGDLLFNPDVLESLMQKVAEPSGEAGTEPGDILINPTPALVPEADFRDTAIVDQLKELLGDPKNRIKLDDFVTRHVRQFLDATDLRNFPVQSKTPTKEQVAERIGQYEEAARDLQQIVIVLATWAEGTQLALIEKVFVRLAEADRGGTGLSVWLKLAWYPLVYLTYSAGIAALAAKNYAAVVTLLQARVAVDRGYGERERPFVDVVVDRATDLHEYFKMLPGHERHFVPRSEYLYKALQPTLEDLLMLGRRYETLFDRFEVLLALEYADVSGTGWGPPGRYAWKHRHEREQSPLRKLVEEAESEAESWPPLQAGLFGKSQERFQKDIHAVEELISKLPWM